MVFEEGLTLRRRGPVAGEYQRDAPASGSATWQLAPRIKKGPDCDCSHWTLFSSDPYGSRTHVAAVKGRCPRPLDEGANHCASISIRQWKAGQATPGEQGGHVGVFWLFSIQPSFKAPGCNQAGRAAGRVRNRSRLSCRAGWRAENARRHLPTTGSKTPVTTGRLYATGKPGAAARHGCGIGAFCHSVRMAGRR